jgi:hypothetical protein
MVGCSAAEQSGRSIVRDGYVDEAVIEKLMASFGAAIDECLQTGSELFRRAAREESADEVERKLARLQEFENKARTQAITIEGLRSEIEDVKKSAASASRPRPAGTATAGERR